MSPPQATYDEFATTNGADASTKRPLEPGLSEPKAKVQLQFPSPPTFDDPYKERKYLKGRLAAAFRIFGKYGFDEGVAGHITLRVSSLGPKCTQLLMSAGPRGPHDVLGEPVWRCILPDESVRLDPSRSRRQGH
jgi:hypothetical protein